MWNRRRAGLVVAGLALLTAVIAWLMPSADSRAQTPDGGAPSAPPDAVSLPTDRPALKRVEAAREFLKAEEWADAIRLLQKLLEDKEDVFLWHDPGRKEGGKPVRYVSARTEAERLLGGLPPAGREAYEVAHGGTARGRLDDAKKAGDLRGLDEVARLYLHTKAGAEALTLLGLYHLDRGEAGAAAGCFARLLRARRPDDWPSLTLFHAAVAFRRAGSLEQSEQLWKPLAARVEKDGLALNGQAVGVEELRKELEREPGGVARPADWAVFRGDARRSAVTAGGAPLLEPRWKADTARESLTRTRLGQGRAHLDNTAQPTLPAFFPLAVGGRLVYRSYHGVHAADLRTGEPAWKQPAALPLGLDNLFADPNRKQQIDDWWKKYPADWHVFFENATVGTLSSDGRRVYAVDDLPLTPHPYVILQMEQGVHVPLSTLRDPLYYSQLRAFDLDTGEPAWTLGGKSAGRKGEAVPPLHDSYFLGPPLPLAGKLYVLAEKKNETRLACLDPVSGDVLWLQTLAAPHDKILLDVGRRIRGAHLAYADGVLVCPTNAGALVAVDLLSRNLLWAHVYRDKGTTITPDGGYPTYNPGFLTAGWKASAPVIHDGKVVFTAADGDSLRCLDLRDGSLVWKTNRLDGDCYLGGVAAGKVLVVGRSAVRALHLKDGSEAWVHNVEQPSGQGVLAGGRYYLPLKRGAVCSLDVETGKDLAVIEPAGRKGKPDPAEVPGNLLFHDGELISQNTVAVAVYPQLAAKLARMDEALRKDPKDPARLTERGLYRLDQGDLPGAAADLRAALANDPPKDVRLQAEGKLFDALTRLLQRDFAAGEKYLDEYQALCQVRVPEGATPEQRARLYDERQRRQVQMRGLVARGREQQGRPAEALRAYQELHALTAHDRRLVSLDQSPVECRPATWAAGRVADLFARTQGDPRLRQLLDDEVAAQWRALQAGKDLDALARFVALFGAHGPAGKEARLRLAEVLLADPDRETWLEAEQHLLQLCGPGEDPKLAARAVEALARLLTRKGLLEDAVAHYRALGRDYARVPVRDGQAGADLLAALETDPRFLPYLVEPRSVWANGKFQVTEHTGSFPPKPYLLYLEPQGEVPPGLQRCRLVFDSGTSQLKLLDRAGAEQWAVTLNLGATRSLLQQVPQWNAAIPYQLKGHVAVLNLGHFVFGLDLGGRRLLWQKELGGVQASGQLQTTFDGTLGIYYPDGWWQRIGTTGPVSSSYAFVQTRQGLQAVDPLRGDVVWSRNDVTTLAELFGDERHVYLVEVRSDGSYGGTRAFRAHDGGAVNVPDFAKLYRGPNVYNTGLLPGPGPKRVAVAGRHLLILEGEPRTGLTLRLYDAHTGKDAWKKQYPAKSHWVRTDLPGLAAVADASGKLTAFELHGQKEVLHAQLEPQHLDKADGLYLFRDRASWYLAVKEPPDNKLVAGEPWPNVQPGLRAAPVNGVLYAFDRATQKLRWYQRLPHQFVLLEQLDESPVLLLSAGLNRPLNGGGQTTVYATKAIDKRTGKLLLNKEQANAPNPAFHGVVVDARAGVVELVGYSWKVRFAVK